jgi:hypothetical protein
MGVDDRRSGVVSTLAFSSALAEQAEIFVATHG